MFLNVSACSCYSDNLEQRDTTRFKKSSNLALGLFEMSKACSECITSDCHTVHFDLVYLGLVLTSGKLRSRQLQLLKLGTAVAIALHHRTSTHLPL